MTANDYMRFAAQCIEIRAEVKPKEGDPHMDLLGLVEYHLAAAAANLRRVGEGQAARDRTAAAEPKKGEFGTMPAEDKGIRKDARII